MSSSATAIWIICVETMPNAFDVLARDHEEVSEC
jgi:hypothetical protein